MREKRLEYGISTLEGACFMLILLFMLFGGIALSVYLQKAYTIDHLLDKYIYDDAVEPLTFDANSNLLPNHFALKSYVDSMVAKIEQELITTDVDKEFQTVPASRYYIEGIYAVVNVDPVSGSFQSIATGSYPAPYSYVHSAGMLAPNLNADLAQAVIDLAQSSISPIPTAGYDPGVSANNYLSQVIIIGARVFFKSEGGLSAQVIDSFGGSGSVLSDFKVIQARGNIR